jgi:hypothetical protein
MSRKRPTDQDRKQAIHLFMSGLARGASAFDLALDIGELHPPNNTFPGEVFMRLSADALQLAGAGQDDPICYRDLLDKYLTECEFKGRQNSKIRFAILASASLRGGIEADLLDEVSWWQTDDFWWYALASGVALIRACADRKGLPVPAFAQQLAAVHEATE